MANDVEIPAVLGPAMQELNERQRRFVLALYDDEGRRKGKTVRAAIAAGYGTKDSSRASMRAQAGRLMMDPKVLAAVDEVGRHRQRGITPLLVSAMERALDDPASKEHGRAMGLAAERAWPVTTLHRVEVEHDHKVSAADIEKAAQRIAELAKRAGVPLPAPGPVIEGEFHEVEEGER